MPTKKTPKTPQPKRAQRNRTQMPKAEMLSPVEVATVAVSRALGHATPKARQRVMSIVREHIAANGMLPDDYGNYLDTIESITEVLYPKTKTLEAKFDALDEELEAARGQSTDDVYNLAVERWTSALNAGIVFGAAMAFSLAYNRGAR